MNSVFNLSTLELEFKNSNFELLVSVNQENEHSTFVAQNTQNVSQANLLEIFENNKFCPIFSPHRIQYFIEFTIVPYSKPCYFENVAIELEAISKSELDQMIASTPTSDIKATDPVMAQGRQIYETQAAFNLERSLACREVAGYVVDFFNKEIKPNNLLDLGCGVGSNALPFLEKGWKVLAVDCLPQVLQQFGREPGVNSYLKSKQLVQLQADISSLNMAEDEYGVVCAIDVLPYLKPLEMSQVINKVYACLKKNGIFIGTLFVKPSQENQKAQRLREFQEQIGVHFYPNAAFVPALLESVGFKIEKCSMRRDFMHGDFKLEIPSVAVQFLVTKS